MAASIAPGSQSHLRSLYRSLLRELPSRPLATHRSPLHQRIRASFTSQPAPSTTEAAASTSAPANAFSQANASDPSSTTSKILSSTSTEAQKRMRVQEAEQFIKYARAQRMYATLLERYNPGIANLDEEERVKLSARRVGMEMPVEFTVKPWGSGGSGEGEK